MQIYFRSITRQTMPTLYKTVKQNGSGDYTDFVTGVADILASGLAATGYYTDYVLEVDNGEYSGYFTAEVPYSGYLHILGSGTWFLPTQASDISGSFSLSSPNVEIDGFCIRSTTSSNVFNIFSGAALSLINTEFLQTTNGIVNSGKLFLDNVSAHGMGQASGGCFIMDYGYSSIASSRIANFASGIYTSDTNINSSTFVDNLRHIVGYSGIVVLSDSLIYGAGSGIVFECTPTGELHITDTTIKSYKPLVLSGVYLQIGKSILYSNTDYCIYGAVESGIVDDSCMYPSGTLISGITQTNVINSDPKFKDANNGDFRLKFKQTVGSPCVELYDLQLYSGVTLYTEQAQFSISDSKGYSVDKFLGFIYKQGNSLLISDYMKELEFASAKEGYKDLIYTVQMRANFTASGVATQPSFNKISNQFPYDWDYKTFETPEITDRHKYLIPRTIVDIPQTISPFISNLQTVQFSVLDKRAYSPVQFNDYRGVGYDFDLNSPGTSIVWMIEGTNQRLIKVNAFTGEFLEDYPLFVPDVSGKYLVKPSGLLYVGVYKDQFRFILESNPSIEILADNADGRFKWISTEIDAQKDARGVVAYKNYLYLTVTEYHPQPIYDRTTTPIYEGSVGKILRYDNNNTFEHFIANYTTSQIGPSGFLLASGNAYPTDLTIYEDGDLVVADWNNNDALFKYRFAYDYAIMQSTYDTETAIILRENYDNVDL